MLGYLNINECNKLPKNDCKLCGGYSSTETFSHQRNICLQLWLLHITQFVLHINLSVADNIVRSLFPPKLSDIYTHSSSALSIMGKVYILSFVIQVRVSSRIKFESLHHNNYVIKVLDGPGTLSVEIPNAGNTYLTSTFQCMIIFGQFTLREKYNTKFSTFDQSVDQQMFVIENRPRKVTFPSSDCQNICVILLGTTTGLYFNITIDSILLQGNDIYTCVLGGITLLPFALKDLGVYSLLCQNFSVTQQQKRSLYSTESYAYLLLFSYNHYSKIEAELVIRTTKCYFMKFSPCLNFQHCRISQHKCTLEFSGTRHVQFTKVLGFGHHGKYRHMAIVYKPLQVDVCTVFQFSGINDHVLQQYQLSPADCVIHLLPDYLHHDLRLPEQTSTFHHDVRAFLGFNSVVLQNLTIFYQSYDGKHFTDETQILVSHKCNNGTWVMSRPELFTLHKLLGWSTKRFFSTNFFHDISIFAQSQTAAHQKKMFEILYRVHPEWSLSWMEVTFWMSASVRSPTTHLLPGGVLFKLSNANPLDLTSGLLTQRGDTIKFKFMRNMKKELSQETYLYTCALKGSYEIVKWSMKTTVQTIVGGYELSLPQTRLLVMCCHNEIGLGLKCSPCKYSFLFFMISQRYQGYFHSEPEECKKTASKTNNLSKCFNIFNFHDKNYTMIWFGEPKSWFHMHRVCNAQGLVLPAFFDLAELGELMTLLKFWRQTLMNEAIFIGLVANTKQTTKVGIVGCLLFAHRTLMDKL